MLAARCGENLKNTAQIRTLEVCLFGHGTEESSMKFAKRLLMVAGAVAIAGSKGFANPWP